MKDGGKGAAQLALNAGDPFSLSEIVSCKEHLRSSNVGICAYCLNDRLLNLVCPECGEQRLSSCSCSNDLSSNWNSCALNVASLGKVSFLLENEKQGTYQGGAEHGPWKSLAMDKSKESVILRRSSGCRIESRRSGIWKVGKLFQRKKKNSDGGDQGQRDCSKSELWVFDEVQISRSRSLRSFRGGDNWNFSGVCNSSVSRNPGPVGYDKKSCFSESDRGKIKSMVLEGGVETGNPDIPRLNRRIFSLRESDYFSGMEEMNLRFWSGAEDRGRKGPIGEGGELRSGSCRVTTRDKLGMKKRNSFMGWRWRSTVNSNWG